MPPPPEGENQHLFKTSVTSVKYHYGPWGRRRHRGRSSSCSIQGSWVMVEDPNPDGDESSEGEPDLELAQFFATRNDRLFDTFGLEKVSKEQVLKHQNADISTIASEDLRTRSCPESSGSHGSRDDYAGNGGVQAQEGYQKDREDVGKEQDGGQCGEEKYDYDFTSLQFHSMDSFASSNVEEGAESSLVRT